MVPSWFDNECNEWLKTRKGLQALIRDNAHIKCSVYDAVRYAHIDYNWPLNMLP